LPKPVQPAKEDKKKSNKIVREGILLKRNEWYWKQERLFVLHANGSIKYFDIDIVQKGAI